MSGCCTGEYRKEMRERMKANRERLGKLLRLQCDPDSQKLEYYVGTRLYLTLNSPNMLHILLDAIEKEHEHTSPGSTTGS